MVQTTDANRVLAVTTDKRKRERRSRKELYKIFYCQTPGGAKHNSGAGLPASAFFLLLLLGWAIRIPMWSTLKYVRHVVARSTRNARQGNIPVTILFFSCLIILLRALSGAGFNQEELASSQSPLANENLPLTGWRAISQGRLEKEWMRLSNSGMLMWEDVIRREKAWQQNWITPAMEALYNRRLRYLGGENGAGAVVIGEGRDQLEVPMDEDEDLFAPEHEYIEKPLPVLNKKIDSTSAS